MRPLSSIVNRNSEKLSFLAISSLKASQDADTLALPIPSCAAMPSGARPLVLTFGLGLGDPLALPLQHQVALKAAMHLGR